MITIKLHQIFNFFIAFMLLWLALAWIRRISRGSKRWKVSEDILTNCRECGFKFTSLAYVEEAVCPNCGQKCQLRWKK